MKTRILKSFYGLALVSVLTLAGATFLRPAQDVRAQGPDDSGQAESQARKLEGTWRVQVTIRDCQTGEALQFPGNPFPALVTFARGGTLTSADSTLLRSAGHGVWSHTGGHTYRAVSEAFLFNLAGFRTGTQRLTQLIEIVDDPEEFKASVSGEILGLDGNLIQTACATSVGRRME
jgi:hypothetical protein